MSDTVTLTDGERSITLTPAQLGYQLGKHGLKVVAKVMRSIVWRTRSIAELVTLRQTVVKQVAYAVPRRAR